MSNYTINALKFIFKLLIVLILILLQIYYFLHFNRFIKIVCILYILKIICSLFVINSKANNSFKLLWIILLTLFPIIFIPIYFFSSYVVNIKIRLQNSIKCASNSENKESKDILEDLLKKDKLLFNLSHFISNCYGTSFRYCDDYKYYANVTNFFSDFINDLKKAEKYIFINFFILSKGDMWEDIKNILFEKMNSGVDVYIMFDSLGSFFRYPRSIKNIKHNKFHLVIYNTLLSGIAPYLNSRNHRKIIVIDGDIGYITGLNIGDEYINNGNFKFKWKDAAIRVNHNILTDLSNMFIELWNSVSKDKISNIEYFAKIDSSNFNSNSNGYLLLYGDKIYSKCHVSKNIYIQTMNMAKNYLYIMTPYLILDEEVKNSLIRSSRSGVDIRIILPKKPDNIFVHTVTRSYYMELLEAGITLYEYCPGFIHSKCLLVDDSIGIIGSANFDFRSMYMLFENAILAYNVNQLNEIKADFSDTFNQSEKIEKSVWSKRSIFQKIGENILKIFAPLL